MIGYLEKEQFEESGVVYPFKTHKQETYGPTRIVDVHYHQHIEILYCLEGTFSVFIGGDHHDFHQGDLVVVNAMEAHAIVAHSKAYGAYEVIRFDPEFLYTSLHAIFEARYILPFTVHYAKHQRLFKGAELEGTLVPYWLLEIVSESQERAYGFELAIKNHLGSIFLWMLRRWHQQGAEVTTTSTVTAATITRLKSALDYVSNHWDEPLRLEAMARRCNMSTSYFSRIFKQVIGRSFSDYINFVRLSRAQQLLMSTEGSITEVALACGFSTASYFIDCFKSHYRQTPLQFRKQMMSSVMNEGL